MHDKIKYSLLINNKYNAKIMDHSEDLDNIDFQNYKGIFYNEGQGQNYEDPETGAHFEYYDMCERLQMIQGKLGNVHSEANLAVNKEENSCKGHELKSLKTFLIKLPNKGSRNVASVQKKYETAGLETQDNLSLRQKKCLIHISSLKKLKKAPNKYQEYSNENSEDFEGKTISLRSISSDKRTQPTNMDNTPLTIRKVFTKNQIKKQIYTRKQKLKEVADEAKKTYFTL